MEQESPEPLQRPLSFSFIGFVLVVPALVGLLSLPWNARVAEGGLHTGFDEFLRAHHHSAMALSMAAAIYVAAIVVGIGCYRASRWIRWAVPLFFFFLALVGWATGDFWDVVSPLVYTLGALYWFYRSGVMVDYFDRRDGTIVRYGA